MAAIVNDRDVKLQAENPRLLSTPLPSNLVVVPSQVTGLPDVYSAIQGVALNASSLVFQVPKAGAITPASLTITANLRNITGVITWTVLSGTVDLHPVGNVATIVATSMTSTTATIQASVTANSQTYSDQVTIARLVDGSDAIIGLLTNESMTVAANPDGSLNAGALTYAGGKFDVFSGINDVTSQATFSVVSQTGVGVSIDATGTYTVTSVTADNGSATLQAVYNGVTIQKVYTIAKARAGANGIRGTVNIGYAITGTTWLDSLAQAALTANQYGSPQLRDIVTLYNLSQNYSQSKYFDGANWISLDAYVNGNMLVTGTITGDKLIANTLGAIKANLGTVTAGTITASSMMGGSYTNWSWPSGSGGGYYLGPEGLKIGTNAGQYLLYDNSTGALTFTGNLSAAGGTFSGTLTASAINAVNTINIANQAVTIPVSATSGTQTIPANSVYGNMVSASINSSGAPIALMFSCQQQATGSSTQGGHSSYVRIVDENNNVLAGPFTVASSNSGVVTGYFSWVIQWIPGAGTHTAFMQSAYSDSVTTQFFNYGTIVLLETKR